MFDFSQEDLSYQEFELSVDLMLAYGMPSSSTSGMKQGACVVCRSTQLAMRRGYQSMGSTFDCGVSPVLAL